jgi:hypothetical protein
MEILKEGTINKVTYDMMCFKQHGGCSTAFRFTDDDVLTNKYSYDSYDGSTNHCHEVSLVCPKCSRQIWLNPNSTKKHLIEYK